MNDILPTSQEMAKKPHALCIPMVGHGHVNPMLKFANLLHFNHFHVTFVSPEFQDIKYLTFEESDSLNSPPGFQFETISDSAVPPNEKTNATPWAEALANSMATNGLVLIRSLIDKLNSSSRDPPVSCIVWDCIIPFLPDFAEDFDDISHVLFWPMSASFLMTYLHKEQIAERIRSLQGKNHEELMKTHIEFIPGLENFRIKDVPSFFWDGNHFFQNLMTQQVGKLPKAPAVILHTFDALETKVLHAMKPLFQPPVYTIGPLNCFEQQIPNNEPRPYKSNIFKENQDCLDWLDSQTLNSVVYVSFGSETVLSRKELIEFGWGLANSGHPFLWVIRTDLVKGDDATLPCDFIEETADRGMICSWCPQEKVLGHSSTGVFLTHSGWNSTMDALCAGVPLISWPFEADQQTNCWSACQEWGIGREIAKSVGRNDIEEVIREMMDGLKGKEMKKNAMDWKLKAQESTKEGGSSYENLQKVLKDVLLVQKKKT